MIKGKLTVQDKETIWILSLFLFVMIAVALFKYIFIG